ncbi:MAG: NaeI family type II restriction endonuclease [Terrimicrobiaceae bacterium]
MSAVEDQGHDKALTAVAAWFRGKHDLAAQLGNILRTALDEVIDGGRTSRWAVDSLEKTEKTYIGTKIEILLKYEFGMTDGSVLDTLIAGHEVDIKCTVRDNWMIPKEAVGHLCLLLRIDDTRHVFQAGLTRTSEEALNPGGNRDGKRGLKASAKQQITWLVKDGDLPSNFLSTISDEVRTKIMSHRSGQKRINELFRLVQRRIIPRNAIETVARQIDPMARMRHARAPLLAEGILVLGHQDEDPETARNYGLPVPNKGESISVAIKSR